MASKSSIESGRGHVTLGVEDGPLERGLKAAEGKFKAWGRGLVAMGADLMRLASVAAVPMAFGIQQFAGYEQALANLRAAANPAAAEFESLRSKIEAISQDTGVGLLDVTNSFAELLKAGVSATNVIAGVGEAAVKFARVGGMEAGQTATILADALNMFARDGLSASQAANIMASAADATTLSIREVSDAFANGGGVAGSYGQTMRDTATILAMFGKEGSIKGGDAGTLLKTLLSRLATGNEGAGAAMAELGLSVYDAAGNMRPMLAILGDLETAVAGMSNDNRNRVLFDLGGSYGIRGLNALLQGGTAGWREMQTAMDGAQTVEQKFATMTDTLYGALNKVWVRVQGVAVAVGEALAPALRAAGSVLMPIIELAEKFAKANQEAVQWIAGVVVGLATMGSALIAAGVALQVTGFGFAFLSGALAFAKTGFGLLTIAQLAWSAITVTTTAIAKIAWLGVSAVVALFGFYMGIANAVLGVGGIGAAAWSAAALVAKAATWLWNAALTVMNALLGGGLLLAAAATVSTLALAFAVVGSAVYGAYHAIKTVIDVLMALPSNMGPIVALTALFEEWYRIIASVIGLLRTDTAAAGQVMSAGFALAVSQVRDLWPPLWTFMREGFAAVWDLAASTFVLKFLQAIATVQAELRAMSVPDVIREALGWDTDLATANTATEVALQSSVRLAEMRLAAATRRFGVNDSPQTTAARAELGRLQEEARYAAFLRMWDEAEGGGSASGRMPGAIPEGGLLATLTRGGVLGAFNAQATFGQLGARSVAESPMERMARLEQRQVELLDSVARVMERQRRILANIERNVGARFS